MISRCSASVRRVPGTSLLLAAGEASAVKAVAPGIVVRQGLPLAVAPLVEAVTVKPVTAMVLAVPVAVRVVSPPVAGPATAVAVLVAVGGGVAVASIRNGGRRGCTHGGEGD